MNTIRPVLGLTLSIACIAIALARAQTAKTVVTPPSPATAFQIFDASALPFESLTVSSPVTALVTNVVESDNHVDPWIEQPMYIPSVFFGKDDGHGNMVSVPHDWSVHHPYVAATEHYVETKVTRAKTVKISSGAETKEVTFETLVAWTREVFAFDLKGKPVRQEDLKAKIDKPFHGSNAYVTNNFAPFGPLTITNTGVIAVTNLAK